MEWIIVDEYLAYAAEQYQPSGAQAARMMKKVYRVRQKVRWKSERVVLRCQNEERLHWMKALFAQPFEQAFSGRGK